MEDRQPTRHRNVRVPVDLDNKIREEAAKYYGGNYAAAFNSMLSRALETWKEEDRIKTAIRQKIIEDIKK